MDSFSSFIIFAASSPSFITTCASFSRSVLTCSIVCASPTCALKNNPNGAIAIMSMNDVFMKLKNVAFLKKLKYKSITKNDTTILSIIDISNSWCSTNSATFSSHCHPKKFSSWLNSPNIMKNKIITIQGIASATNFSSHPILVSLKLFHFSFQAGRFFSFCFLSLWNLCR